jgi:CheY-like chemotaxis protein
MENFERIMCIEDDPDILLILDFSLRRMGGFSVCLCAGGREALNKVDEFRPQLVLLDVMMPEMSGPQTLSSLWELPTMRGIPIVFMTAKAMQNEVEDLSVYGASGIIVKPFDTVTLPNDLRIYWEHGRGTCV